MNNFKKYLIDFSHNLREKKDNFKNFVKEGYSLKEGSSEEIIFPPYSFDTSIELQSDQWWFNGFVIKIKNDLIVVDPGVDFYSRFTRTRLDLTNIVAIIVSHGHTDHIASLNVFLEKILRNKSRNVELFISQSALENEVSKYYQDKLFSSGNISVYEIKDNLGIIKQKVNKKFPIEFFPLFHGIKDTFGFKLLTNRNKIGYVCDTGYAIEVQTNEGFFPPETARGDFIKITKSRDQIKNFYSDVTTAVVNINDLQYNRHSKYHLSGWDVINIFENSQLEKLILNHLPVINIEGEDSNYLYKLFFSDQKYEAIIPHYLGRVITL